MTDRQALRKLIEAVELGEPLSFKLFIDYLGADNFLHAHAAYNGSLDAAKALHEALLPGWDIQINTYEDDSFEASVSKPTDVKTFDGVSGLMARAWLLAILRAYEAHQ